VFLVVSCVEMATIHNIYGDVLFMSVYDVIDWLNTKPGFILFSAAFPLNLSCTVNHSKMIHEVKHALLTNAGISNADACKWKVAHE